MLVDYLFIDILSAPTADSLKLDELDTVHRLAGVLANLGTTAISATRKMGRRISQAAQQATGMIIKPEFKQTIDRTRTIPPMTLEAQIIASRSAGHLITDLTQKNNSRVEQRKTERASSILLQKRKTFIKLRSTKGQNSNAKASNPIEDLFTDLWVDLTEQRKLLPPTEQEYFDEKWG